jgi:hypothetical protein
LRLIDPEAAKEQEKYYFERNELDDIAQQESDLSEVRYYPGSPKGPYPSDDPDHYSKWFIDN